MFKLWYQEFLDYLQNIRNYSSLTIVSYENDLKYFTNFIQDHIGSEITLSKLANLTITDFRSLLFKRSQDNFDSNSTRRFVSTLRSLYKYLAEKHSIQNKAIQVLKSPKTKERIPKAIHQADFPEIESMLDEINDHPWVLKRDIALLTLIYACGLRISEALNIRKNDIQHDYIKVLGKGNKQRLVPLISIAKEKLDQYILSIPYS
ncbi:MAG: site-specific integrase, partial [Alphaproteobacteria bacterium]|nr:site-specific integrase [Alphaproteobacteria bacterium]